MDLVPLSSKASIGEMYSPSEYCSGLDDVQYYGPILATVSCTSICLNIALVVIMMIMFMIVMTIAIIMMTISCCCNSQYHPH